MALCSPAGRRPAPRCRTPAWGFLLPISLLGSRLGKRASCGCGCACAVRVPVWVVRRPTCRCFFLLFWWCVGGCVSPKDARRDPARQMCVCVCNLTEQVCRSAVPNHVLPNLIFAIERERETEKKRSQ